MEEGHIGKLENRYESVLRGLACSTFTLGVLKLALLLMSRGE